MKFIKIISVKHEFYEKYGDIKNIDKPHYLRKYGNIKDPKHCNRPYLLFMDENNIYWVVPSTTKVNGKRRNLINSSPEEYLLYFSFSSGKKQKTCFEFNQLTPISSIYFCDYKISYKDSFSWVKRTDEIERQWKFLLLSVINTNYFIENNLGLSKYEIKEGSDRWNSYIKKIEKMALNQWKKEKFNQVRKIKLIKDQKLK